MKFIFAFLWSFMLVTLLNYVVSSVKNVPFDFELGAILSVIFAVLVLIVTSLLGGNDEEHAAHH